MPGVEDLFAGALLGTALQLLWEAIKDAKAKNMKFKIALENLEKTVESLTPTIIEIEKLHQELMHSSREEIRLLHGQLEKARKLVSTCSEIRRWNKVKRYRYGKRLSELDSSLSKLVKVDFQAAQSLDILKILSEVTNINKKLDRMNLEKKNHFCETSKENSSNPRAGAVAEVKEESSDPETESEGVSHSRFKIEYKSKKKRTEIRIQFRRHVKRY